MPVPVYPKASKAVVLVPLSTLSLQHIRLLTFASISFKYSSIMLVFPSCNEIPIIEYS